MNTCVRSILSSAMSFTYQRNEQRNPSSDNTKARNNHKKYEENGNKNQREQTLKKTQKGLLFVC